MVDSIHNHAGRPVAAFGTAAASTRPLTDQDRLQVAAEGLRAAASMLREYARATSNRAEKKPSMELAQKLERRDPGTMMDNPRAYDQLFRGLTASEVDLFKRAEQHAVAQTLAPATGQ